MNLLSLEKELKENTYPGRGIVIGRSPDGKYAVTAYFIMGRSENSRNRIFVEEGEGIRTEAFDPSKLSDPSLIIYAPVRVLGKKTIVTNGDQPDTIYTPRISGILHVERGNFNYAMSILKSDHGNPDSCNRFTFAYSDPIAGEGRFIHTYQCDGEPLPSFEGEPKPVAVLDDMDAFADMLWQNLNESNKVSLFVRYIDIASGEFRTKIINKNK